MRQELEPRGYFDETTLPYVHRVSVLSIVSQPGEHCRKRTALEPLLALGSGRPSGLPVAAPARQNDNDELPGGLPPVARQDGSAAARGNE